MSVLNQIETSTVLMKIKNDILYIIVKEDADLGIDEIKEAIEARIKIQGEKPILTIVDNRKVWQLTKEASLYSSSIEVAQLSKAMALLSDTSLGARLIANFFIKINKQHVPTKLFKSEDKALNWLQSFK